MDFHSHLWTLAPRLRHAVRPLGGPASRPWETVVADPKLGPVRLSGRLREMGGEELVVLVHGLGGCTESHYLVRGDLAAAAAGLSSLRLNMRGSDRAGEDFYHAGLTADLHAALASEALHRYRRIYVLGYSLGGHLALRLAAEEADPRVAAVAAVCAPLDLARSAAAIDGPALWLYRRYLLANLKRIYAAVAARRPGLPPVEEVAGIDRLREWDDRVVAPRHGFRDAADYYARESVAPRLADLRVPALLLAAERDPMVPAATVRPALGAAAPRLEVRWLARGGHCGFPRGLDLGLEGTGEAVGLDAQAVAWLRRH